MYTFMEEGLLEYVGVLDFRLPLSKRLELNVSHVEMGLLIRQDDVVPITSRPLQDEGTGYSDGLP
jgi:hypothetical protein